ncbi:MAG TPA: pantoate--beta-alanine ligase [Peptococcaceae bacterium]|nr:MAG: Pantothenate synthetase [Clostridia bacterium 41_269]HBT20659.1 pantoate--beta-alanine ligase [Peptococcaceae bacterium]
MIVITSAVEMQNLCRRLKMQGRTIGLVPTMGYLHEGHLSLMRRSVEENDFTVASIFVNPTQFGENEDYDTYPRDLERDKKLAEEVGVDAVFAPSVEEMYPSGYCTYVEVLGLTEVMCGASRPGHFRGVTTVVSKLFNITQPDRAYFGQKDAQQALVIRRMIRDLNFPIEIVIMPIVRERDGLAMSSRNTYLNDEERKAALVVPKSLQKGKELLLSGEKKAERIIYAIKKIIEAEPLAKIDYVTVRDIETLREVETISGPVLVAVAVWIGKTRLIDNFVWGDHPCFEKC